MLVNILLNNNQKKITSKIIYLRSSSKSRDPKKIEQIETLVMFR